MSAVWHNPLPLQGWFLVSSSQALPRGAVMGFDLMEKALVAYRGWDGVVRAVGAHCPHMGTHLRHATVEANALRCPLHHWRWSAVMPDPAAGETRCLPFYPVREACGGVWVFSEMPVGEVVPFPMFPGVQDGDLHYQHGRPVFLRCPWQAVVANAFDLNHFQTVHERALVGVPEISERGACLEFRYVSQVTGRSFPDRVMRALSGNRIEVTIRCWHGSILMVRTRTRHRETFLWLNFLPSDGGTLVKPIYAVARGGAPGAAAVRVRLTAWLFHAFLRKDIEILDRMRFAPVVTEQEDPYLFAYLRFVEKRASSSLSS